MEIVERDAFFVCGYSVETDAAHNDYDIARLYKDFFDKNREAVLLRLPGGKKGYFGLSWYTSEHDKYCYLLGLEVGAKSKPPKGAQIKAVPQGLFATASYAQDQDIKAAWTEFYYSDIPRAGYMPNETRNLYFEYYPDSAPGDYELWVPVVKVNL